MMNNEVDYELENKRVLVTGSTSGIGEGIAKLFAKLGASVIINGRNSEETERVATEIKNSGEKAIIVVVTEVSTAGYTSIVPSSAARRGVFPRSKWV